MTPDAKLPDLALPVVPAPDEGPVLIQIEYTIAPEHRAEFLDAIHAVEPIRRRNGAGSWRVYRDLGEEGRYIERFVIASWAEYTRLRTRMTQTDRRTQERAERLQQKGVPRARVALPGCGARRTAAAGVAAARLGTPDGADGGEIG